ncbi:TPA: hypothetical protein LSH94_002992 [Morganella morganii]|uniref:hypothetical protein n=1 Tax=Morganella morganii TaxID=582 RepID=UPI002806F65E|nr:hypothetical protein [Morganella morganii]HDU8708162.1 hypothetical protein [Morganella morganii subsp. morganii]ELF0883609.1 hypothetical protein [Morganella morganii]HBL6966749.1 hypothetical protein [Morganella morganii]HCR3185227.1 hypothetical protein [Morganella morganii]
MLKADSQRKREFYTDYVYRNLNEALSPTFRSGRILGENELNDLIRKNITDKKERSYFIRRANTAYKESLTEDRFFDWINNERIALYVIQFIHNYIYDDYLQSLAVKTRPGYRNHYPSFGETPHIRNMGLPETPCGLRQLKDTIKSYFDRLDIPQGVKELLIDHIRTDWFNQNTDWLFWIENKNKAQVDWAVKYMRGHFKSDDNNMLYYYYPSSALNRIYGFFDIILTSNESRELFIIKMKKAWAQSRYRESIKDKKVINTYVSNDVKEKLKEIVRISNKKTTEVISDLIRREYDRLKK